MQRTIPAFIPAIQLDDQAIAEALQAIDDFGLYMDGLISYDELFDSITIDVDWYEIPRQISLPAWPKSRQITI